MARLRFGIIAIGIALVGLGIKTAHERSLTDTISQNLTCAALGENGYGDNAYVDLTDGMLCDFDFVYAADEGTNKWTDVWVPVVPRDSEYAQECRDLRDLEGDHAEFPDVPSFRVLVYMPRATNSKDVQAAASRDRLRGIVINTIDPLESDAREFLTKTYPRANLDSLQILQLDRQPPGVGRIFGYFAGGVVFLAIGGIWLYVSNARERMPPSGPSYPPMRQRMPPRPRATHGPLARR